MLRELFGRVVTDDHDPPLPPRSPDLTYCDFFVFGFIKDRIFRPPNAPTTLIELEHRIIEVCNEITPAMLENVAESLYNRALMCERVGGGLIGHLDYKPEL